MSDRMGIRLDATKLDHGCLSREAVVVPSGQVAGIERDQVEAHGRKCLALRKEPIGDSTLIEDLDRA